MYKQKNKMELSVEKLVDGISLKYDYLNTTIAGTSENIIKITRTTNPKKKPEKSGFFSLFTKNTQKL